MLKSTSFIFDGKPSDDYGLMIYFLNDEATRELNLGTNVNVVEDRIANRITPIHYGTNINQSMSFTLTFGSVEYLEDYEVDAILGWLTGHNTYKYLEYVDGDHYVRYKCILNDFKSVYINGLPIAFSCTVMCDGQFGYEYPITTTYTVTDTERVIDFFNRGSYNGYLKPKLKIKFDDDASGISIVNQTDNNREFKVDYFDRVKKTEAISNYAYSTTLENIAIASNDKEYITWGSINASDKYKELIKISEWNELLVNGNTLLLLPKQNDKALLSLNRGKDWEQVALPQVGTFTGCYSKDKCVIVDCTIPTDIVYYSDDSKNWYSTIDTAKLPIKQIWRSICYAEDINAYATQMFIAVGSSGVGAVSTTGMNWNTLSINLPTGNYAGVIYGGGVALAYEEQSNKIAIALSAEEWFEVALPDVVKIKAVIYANDKYILLCKDRILTTQNFSNWEEYKMQKEYERIYIWEKIYIVTKDGEYAITADFKQWKENKFKKDLFSIGQTPLSNKSIIGVGYDDIWTPVVIAGKYGEFIIPVDNIDKDINDIYIYASVDNPTSTTPTYSSVGEVLLLSEVNGKITRFGMCQIADEISQNINGEVGDGIFVEAVWDKEHKKIKIIYDFNSTNEELRSAKVNFNIKYNYNYIVDLGLQQLELTFDNDNQIITSNRDGLNFYKYFNMNFFRLLKGKNRLKIKTNKGKVNLIIECEFLRKVGGA